MKYFNIDGSINEEMQRKFVEFANNNGDEDWTIAIFSNGGTKVFARFILSVINKHPKKVILISQESYSAAFTLFMDAKCKRQITYGGKGMVHYGRSEMMIMGNGKPAYFEDESILKNFKQRRKAEYKEIKKFLSIKEKSKFKKGEDVYFTFKRMKEIFPDAEVI